MQKSRVRRVGALLVGLAFVATACGSDDDDAGSNGSRHRGRQRPPTRRHDRRTGGHRCSGGHRRDRTSHRCCRRRPSAAGTSDVGGDLAGLQGHHAVDRAGATTSRLACSRSTGASSTTTTQPRPTTLTTIIALAVELARTTASPTPARSRASPVTVRSAPTYATCKADHRRRRRPRLRRLLRTDHVERLRRAARGQLRRPDHGRRQPHRRLAHRPTAGQGSRRRRRRRRSRSRAPAPVTACSRSARSCPSDGQPGVPRATRVRRRRPGHHRHQRGRWRARQGRRRQQG